LTERQAARRRAALGAEHVVVEHVPLPALDVHFEHVHEGVPELRHDRGQRLVSAAVAAPGALERKPTNKSTQKAPKRSLNKSSMPTQAQRDKVAESAL
jgi:hypothetical protein